MPMIKNDNDNAEIIWNLKEEPIKEQNHPDTQSQSKKYRKDVVGTQIGRGTADC